MELVGEASGGTEAVELAARLAPDVVVMDASMPRADGVEATRRIAADHPDIRLIGLSMFDDDIARQMTDAGAEMHLSPTGPSSGLMAAVCGEGG